MKGDVLERRVVTTLGDFVIDVTKRCHKHHFSRFAARKFPGLTEEVHLATYARQNETVTSMGIVKRVGIDRIRRDLHAIFAAGIQLPTFIFACAVIIGTPFSVSYGLDHVREIQSIYRSGQAGSEMPTTLKDRALEKAAGAVQTWKDGRSAKREDAYEAARANRGNH